VIDTLGQRVALALPLLLAACAVPPSKPLPKYAGPTAGPTAKLVMRGSVPAGDLYSVYIFDDAEHCKGLRSMGAGSSTRNPASTTLAANQITTVEFFLLKPDKKFCSIRWSFTPVAGKTYLFSGAALDATTCGARVMDMSNPDNLRPEPTALRRNPGASLCVPLPQSKAASVAGTDAGQTSPDAVLRQGATAEDLQGLIGQ
jgi:hypothetical protein